MNNILPSGFPRFNSGNLTNNITFDNQSTIIGEYAGKDLNLSINPILRNLNNTFIGLKAGQNSLDVGDTILIGRETGMNLYTGSNNIIIGRDNDEGFLMTMFDVISLGYMNKTADDSISLGSYNTSLGYQNLLTGKHNEVVGYDNINIGNKNILQNVNRSICIGNNNYYMNDSNIIMIGNDLHQDAVNPFTMNIGNILYGTKKEIYVGTSALPVAIGYDYDEIHQSFDTSYSLYTRDGVHTNRMKVGSVTLLGNHADASQDIVYTLPALPTNYMNVALSLNNSNEMIWTRLYMNTDEILQGRSNLFYNEPMIDRRVDARFDANLSQRFSTYFNLDFDTKIQTVTLDSLKNGLTNQMIIDKQYNNDLFINGTLSVDRLIVNKIEVVGYGNEYMPAGVKHDNNYNITSNEFIATINVLLARIKVLERQLNINQM